MSQRSPQGTLPLLSLAALGVVFGDIGTSPLYTFKTILFMTGENRDPLVILGLLSLVFWTLIIITALKYVTFAMRFDNDGEGGIMALLAMLRIKKRRGAIITIGLFGAALIYGDGAITPAISVLSAIEGLDMVTPDFQPYIVPIAVTILLILFAIQYRGSALIGRTFGPVMLLWFLVMAAMGIHGILQHPSILQAMNPWHACHYLFHHGWVGFFALGGVFLCVTGAEALYADMGHFGRRPIWLAWYLIVLPSLLLNYAGQAAIVLEGAPIDINIFYRLCPPVFLMPLVILATIATIIASQAIITGAFSMTRQAILLGWLPRLQIKQTSSQGFGQIYVAVVNFMLMIVTISLTIGFGKSENLAAAYGIAVAMTMLMTSGLLFIAMREIWHWSLFYAASVAGFFIVIDSAFLLANLSKIEVGGYIPLLMATVVYTIMWVWHRGANTVMKRHHQALIPVPKFLQKITDEKIPRVPGTAVFLTRSKKDTPSVMSWHIKHNRALQQNIFVLRIRVRQIPWVQENKRLSMMEVAPNFWRAVACYGFMERPDIPKLLEECKNFGCLFDFTDATYYIGHTTVVRREDGKGMPLWQQKLFAMMERNAAHLDDYFSLPSNQVVEIGRQVAI